jgi:lauroyl/myristoyl acyltransferase
MKQNGTGVVDTAKTTRLIRARDISSIVQMALLTAISWIVPERRWPSIARDLARVVLRLKSRPGSTQLPSQWLMFVDGIKTTVLSRLPASSLAHRYVARMQGFREFRPGGWGPEIQIEGAKHIEWALSQGHGVVLWVAGFVYSDLVTKKGLHEAGYLVSHLSRPTHGISPTRFGVRILNPFWTRIENRYLAERVVIRNNDSRAALAVLRARLKEGRIVSITVGDQARRTAEVNLPSTTVRIATGPLHLARTMNAVLLPVFTVIRKTGTIVVNVEGPLIGGGDEQGKAYECLAQCYACKLEGYLQQYPDQWNQSWAIADSHSNSRRHKGRPTKPGSSLR